MTAQPKVTVIVLNWNGLDDTAECLEGLQSCAYPRFETIVVDNGSDNDEAGRLGQRFGDSVQIIENEANYGFAGGCNVAIRRALTRGADYVLLLNNDTVVDPAFLASLVSAAEGLPDAAAVCPKICDYHQRRLIQSTGGRVNPWTGRAHQVGRDEPDDGRYDRIEERDYADGACMLIRRSALERVGLLDEDYFAYWEETDWCDRARAAGFKCYYVPTARIWHKGGRAFDADSQRRYLFRRNAFLFLRKRKRVYHLVSAALFHLFVLAPLYVIRRPLSAGRLVAEARALLWHLPPARRQGASPPAQKPKLSGRREHPRP
ncbi:MAG TPA: glycosyltransferase family 2 protein [Dehalococcoidia bacterium]|nr:glycosyltransferase family 2 protein [Dehalococcoidia bacterium]